MNAVQSRRYEMLVRVRDFGDAHADLFRESSLAQQTFAAVAEAVEQLNAHTVSKLSAVPGMTPKVMARADLHDRLEAISQTARVIPARATEGFNTKQMNEAVFAFRRYEDASLRYTGIESHEGLTHYGLYDTVVSRD